MAKNSNGVNKLALGVGLAAGAIGAYFLYGSKSAKSNRKKVGSWMLKARAEVMEAVENIKEIDKAAYFKVVDDVIKKYTGVYTSSREAKTIAKEMKAAWYHIGNTVKPAKKAVSKVVKKIRS